MLLALLGCDTPGQSVRWHWVPLLTPWPRRGQPQLASPLCRSLPVCGLPSSLTVPHHLVTSFPIPLPGAAGAPRGLALLQVTL